MPGQREVELKFLFDPEDADLLSGSEVLARARPQAPIHLRSGYFDTPAHDLKTKGVFVRVRNYGEGWLQSVKQSYGVDRFEFENKIDQPIPRLDLAPELTALGGSARLDELQEVFATHVLRRPFLVASSAATIEVVIDAGEITTPDGKTLPISELEVELKDGDPLEVFRLARRLAEFASLTLSLVSKGERGFILAEGRWGLPHEASNPDLARDMNVADCFAAICRVCLHDFMLNQIARPQADVVESLHQTRVAARRLRAALGFFKPAVEDDAFTEMADGLKWISRLLGAVRDFDVWQSKTFEPAARQTAGKGFRELAASVATEREHARLRLNQALASERLRRYFLEFALWLEHGDWRAEDSLANTTPIVDFLDRRMKRGIRKLRRRGRNFDRLNEHQQHELRIRAKTLRYNLEFFKPLAEGRETQRSLEKMLKGLETMQSSIGKLHDAVALSDFLLAHLAKAGGAPNRRLGTAAASAAKRLAAPLRNRHKLHRKARRGYKRFARARVDWA